MTKTIQQFELLKVTRDGQVAFEIAADIKDQSTSFVIRNAVPYAHLESFSIYKKVLQWYAYPDLGLGDRMMLAYYVDFPTIEELLEKIGG